MHRHALRFVVCASLLLLTGSAFSAQTPAPTDIYEHFIGTWVGNDAYMKDGVSRQIPVEIIITETKKRDRLRLDYIYGQKGRRDFDRETKFLKLNPAKAEFDIQWEGEWKDTYKATGLDEFAKSGLGGFTGANENPNGGEQDRISRVIFTLTDSTLTYEWQHGPDVNHLVFLSMFTLSRSTVAGQP